MKITKILFKIIKRKETLIFRKKINTQINFYQNSTKSTFKFYKDIVMNILKI